METLQILSLIFSVINIFLLLLWMKENKKDSLSAVPVLSWVIHVILFYILRILSLHGLFQAPQTFFSVSTLFFTTWSSYVRLHGVATVFYTLFLITGMDIKIISLVKKLWKHYKN